MQVIGLGFEDTQPLYSDKPHLGSDSAIYQLCDLGQLIDIYEPQVLHE